MTVNGESASRHFTIAINPPPFFITTASLPDASAGAAYQVFLVATGGTAPYAWSVASGSLPPGLTLSSAGELAGTLGASGTFTFTGRADDSSPPGFQQSATATFSLVVDP